MTLDETKELLTNHEIPFVQVEYESEIEFFKHLKNQSEKARPYKVIALVIKSKNGKKDLEIQFNIIGNNVLFQDLWFGAYWYELFDCSDETLGNEILNTVISIMNGGESVILIYNYKSDRCIGSLNFVRSNDDGVFDSLGLKKTMEKIEKKKTFISKIFNYKRKYEIYDWNTYRLIIK